MKIDSHDVAGWTPVAEVAQRLGTTPLNVLMHIKRGLLAGAEREGGWLVDPESLATLLSKRAAGELPAVCQSGCAKKAGGCGTCS
jgi:hypothetical protein